MAFGTSEKHSIDAFLSGIFLSSDLTSLVEPDIMHEVHWKGCELLGEEAAASLGRKLLELSWSLSECYFCVVLVCGVG